MGSRTSKRGFWKKAHSMSEKLNTVQYDRDMGSMGQKNIKFQMWLVTDVNMMQHGRISTMLYQVKKPNIRDYMDFMILFI